MKFPNKYAKRPEFIDVDNAVKNPKQYRGEYVKNLPGVFFRTQPVGASVSGRMGGLPYAAMQNAGPSGTVDPVQTRTRRSPNPLEEHQ